MRKRLLFVMMVSLTALPLAGCGNKSSGDVAPTSSSGVSVKPTPSAAATATTVAPTAEAKAAKPPPDGAVTVAKMQDDFKADEKKWMGKKAKVYGLYLNTNTVKSGGKEAHSIVVIDEKGKMTPSLSCEVAGKADDLKQYDEVVVEGTVDKSFGARLKDCSYTKR